jgi:hypothetical protein
MKGRPEWQWHVMPIFRAWRRRSERRVFRCPRIAETRSEFLTHSVIPVPNLRQGLEMIHSPLISRPSIWMSFLGPRGVPLPIDVRSFRHNHGALDSHVVALFSVSVSSCPLSYAVHLDRDALRGVCIQFYDGVCGRPRKRAMPGLFGLQRRCLRPSSCGSLSRHCPSSALSPPGAARRGHGSSGERCRARRALGSMEIIRCRCLQDPSPAVVLAQPGARKSRPFLVNVVDDTDARCIRAASEFSPAMKSFEQRNRSWSDLSLSPLAGPRGPAGWSR